MTDFNIKTLKGSTDMYIMCFYFILVCIFQGTPPIIPNLDSIKSLSSLSHID